MATRPPASSITFLSPTSINSHGFFPTPTRLTQETRPSSLFGSHFCQSLGFFRSKRQKIEKAMPFLYSVSPHFHTRPGHRVDDRSRLLCCLAPSPEPLRDPVVASGPQSNKKAFLHESFPGPWTESGDMSLLSCARKHRSLLWYRHHRAMMRRHALAAAASTSSTSKKKAGTLTLLLPVATASTPTPSPAIQASKPREISSTSSTSAKTAAMELHDDTRAVPVEESASSPWRALFLTFFAMIQPEKIKQPLAVDTEFLDDLHVNPVPPNVSDVVEHPEHLIWRYDMDSYAANSHNEDRSQYILDSIALECEESPEHDGPEVSMPVFFCGCYDGHGGEQAVEFVQRNLYRNIKNHMRRHVGSVTDAIISGFQETDQEFHRRSLLEFERGEWSACSVGACAVIAMIVDTKLYVASCGDCRAIMAYREPNGSLSVEQITWDHSANDEREQERLKLLYPDDYDIVREIGAHNYYVKGRLQPTRSLGDTYMKVQDVNRAPMPRGLRIRGSFKRPYITAIPDVFEVDLNERHPEFLVLGSDGLYGELSNQEIAQMVDKFRVQGVENVSQALRASVLERIAEYYGFSKKELEQISPGERRNYHDDITIDVVHFAPPPSLSQDEPVAA